jgi:formamidopyrimidine-DNA glycosylase
MIELPEATTIARQINAELKGKRIAEGNQGNSPHKFAFYSYPAEAYAALLRDKTLGETTANGVLILVTLEPGYTLILGEGGERIIYHRSAATLPQKRQLLLHFTDDTYLTVSIQGWGATLLLPQADVASHPYVYLSKPSPLSEAFTREFFKGLFAELEPDDPRSIKFFLISKPGVLGIGNGCLQDILWRAKIHPRRRAVGLSEAEQGALYTAMRQTLREMVDCGGRDGDFDLYGHPGGYQRLLHAKSVGQPCPDCGTPFEKASYQGGSVYYCPKCQTAA